MKTTEPQRASSPAPAAVRTIGSSLEIRACIERMREQVANLE